MVHTKNSPVTLQQVAQHAGVSRATASLVVRGSRKISDATREKVFDAIHELGYVYDRVAANLRSRTSSTVGLIIMELANSFYSELLMGIHHELDKFGQTVFLGTTFDSHDVQERLISTMLEHRVGGIILSAVPGSKPATVNRIQSLGIPVVLVGRQLPGTQCDYVGIDNIRGGWIATRHLIELGHRRIAFLGGLSQMSSWQGRYQGYATALKEAGLPVEPKLVRESRATMQCGIDLVTQLIQEPNPPSAIFCYNDIFAIGAMMKLKDLGVTPGSDIAIVGFDDIPEASIFSPKLTTVSSCIKAMGKHAASMLLQRIEGLPAEPRRITLEPKLIIRHSCLPFNLLKPERG